MLIATNFILSMVAALSFLYFFWKKLKDDYSAYQVFSVGFYSLVGLFIGFLISKFYLQSFWFWLPMVGSSLGLVYGINHFKLNFFESFEGWVIGTLSIITIENLNKLIWNFDFFNIINFLVALSLILIFFYINRRYKRYVWYRSGKVGFSGLLIAGLYFVFQASFLMISGIMNQVKIFEAILFGLFAIGSFLTLFILAKNKN